MSSLVANTTSNWTANSCGSKSYPIADMVTVLLASIACSASTLAKCSRGHELASRFIQLHNRRQTMLDIEGIKKRTDDAKHYATCPKAHACQSCGTVWRPAIVAMVGVQFLPGFKNDTTLPASEPLCTCPASSEYELPCPRYGIVGIGVTPRS